MISNAIHNPDIIQDAVLEYAKSLVYENYIQVRSGELVNRDIADELSKGKLSIDVQTRQGDTNNDFNCSLRITREAFTTKTNTARISTPKFALSINMKYDENLKGFTADKIIFKGKIGKLDSDTTLPVLKDVKPSKKLQIESVQCETPFRPFGSSISLNTSFDS